MAECWYFRIDDAGDVVRSRHASPIAAQMQADHDRVVGLAVKAWIEGDDGRPVWSTRDLSVRQRQDARARVLGGE